MKISVIVPCHNCGLWVTEALRSVSSQTYPVLEIIAINDCSTDDTVEKIEASGVKVRLLSSSRGNAAAARNLGIREANGDWIAFLDSDNVWFPRHIESLVSLLENGRENRKLVAVYSWPSLVCDDEKAELTTGPILSKNQHLSHDDFLEIRGIRRYGFPTTGMIISKRRLDEIGGFNEKQIRRHDFDLFMRATYANTWSCCINPTWWGRPPRPGNISANEVSCRLYALKAFVRHNKVYASPIMEKVLMAEVSASYVIALEDKSQEGYELRSICQAYMSKTRELNLRFRAWAGRTLRGLRNSS